MLAWSMLTPTLALAGSVGAKNASLRRPANPGARAHASTQTGPPSNSAASSKSEKGDAPGGSGKDFWLLAPAPARGGGATSVLLAGDSDAEGEVSAPGFEKRFDVRPGKATSIEVPAPAAGGDETKGSGAVALHVEATGFVSASVLSRGGEGARSYIGFPSEALGTEYIAAGGGHEAGGRSRLYVLGVDDSTTVTINPTVAAEGHAPGESYSVKLDKGAAYELAEDLSAGDDLTGTVVSSDKPVAAFVGYEDASATPGGARGAGWFAQLTPSDAWGRSFVASPSGEYGGRLRVVASTDDTHVAIDGAEAATINRGRSYEQAIGSHALVSTDKPALVALRSNEFDPSGQTTAAPLVLVTPAERFAKSYTFVTPADGFDRHHLNVVILGGAGTGLTLDGTPVSPSSYASIGEGRFSVATLDVRGGAHRLASAKPVGLTAYGEGGSSRYAYSYGASPNAPATKGKDALATNSLDATSATTASASDCGDLVSIVRHAPNVNGRVEGSLQMLSGEYVNLNSGNVITSDLLVPGTPSIQINGSPNYQGTIDGNGAATPTGYGVTINSGAQVRHVVRRTNPVTLASVPVPPSSNGTRSVTIDSPGQSAGTWSTVRDLTLNSGVGAVTVPAGTYNNFTANDGSYLVFGTAGATVPSVYNFDTLTLNSNSALRLLGPVRINVASRVSVSSGAVMGYDQNPRWMELNVARYDVTVNSLASLYGVVRAPAGTVNVNGRLRGSVESDRLSVNGGASLEWMGCATPANQAPTVSAGANQTVTLPNTAFLNGSASDDGLPAGGGLTVMWSKVSGPGDVTFADAAQAATTVTFSVPGVYTLRLTVNDTRLAASDEIVVTVLPVNLPPAVSAGPDASVSLGANLLRNAGAEDALVEGQIPFWVSDDGVAWAQGTPGSFGLPFGVEGSTYFYPAALLDTELRQDVDVSVFAPLVDAGAQEFVFKGYVRAPAGLPADDSRVIVEYRDASGVVLSSFDSGIIASPAAWAEVSDARVAPAGTRSMRVRLLSVKANAQAGGGLFDNLSLRAPGAASAVLAGGATDDGNPAGSTLAVAWSKVSGPGEVRFANASSASTTATFDAAGAYVLRLTANDSEFSKSDDVTVNVTRANLPPAVNAGADARTIVSQPLILSGAATDDGLPAGPTLTYSWSKSSGPGSAAFDNNTSAATTVTFDAPGAYVLRLTAGDSEYVIADDLAVTVEPANVAPTVDAGVDQTVALAGGPRSAGVCPTKDCRTALRSSSSGARQAAPAM